MARLHDDIVKRIKRGIEFDKRQGLQYDFGIENPKDDLEQRDYMQPSSWDTPMSVKTCHCCAYHYALQCKKPMMFATNMDSYQPVGFTGNGLCNNGKCGMCLEKGGHIGKLARDPKLGPHGLGAKKAKNSLPPAWIEEFLLHAMERARSQGRSADIVVDVCSGWQSLKAVCAKLGLRYIALDIFGDRNIRKSARKASSSSGAA